MMPFALTPVIGLTRAVCAAPRIAVPIGYDIDAALETLIPPSG